MNLSDVTGAIPRIKASILKRGSLGQFLAEIKAGCITPGQHSDRLKMIKSWNALAGRPSIMLLLRQDNRHSGVNLPHVSFGSPVMIVLVAFSFLFAVQLTV